MGLWTLGATAAVAVGILVAVALFSQVSQDGGGPDAARTGAPAPVEPFRVFPNRTGLPDELVWEAYRFAIANPRSVLLYTPCYCGCNHHGDSNNRDCFIDTMKADGTIVFDDHAAT